MLPLCVESMLYAQNVILSSYPKNGRGLAMRSNIGNIKGLFLMVCKSCWSGFRGVLNLVYFRQHAIYYARAKYGYYA